MAVYKLFASDLDGTMLNRQSEMSDENFAAINAMLQKGVEFIPVTGRCLKETPDNIKNCKDIHYIINSNGASIYNVKTKTSHTTEIKKDTLKKIFEILSKYTVLVVAHSNNEDFVDKKDCSAEVFDYHRMSKAYKDIILPISTPVENLEDKLLGDSPAEMLALFFKYDDELKECQKLLSEIKEINATSSTGGNMEIIDATVSKGNTLKNLASVMGIKPSEIITAGDNHNDVSLTTAFGLSLAVSGAVDEMKQKADKVICSNNDNVADYVYKNFINI